MNILKHKFVSTKSDGPDATKFRPSNINEEHVFAGGVDGQQLCRDSTQSDGANWKYGISTLSVQTAATGNVGGGEDDLMVYVVPANTLVLGNGVRVIAWGTTANNANTKTLIFYAGASAILTTSLPDSQVGVWKLEIVITKTGSSAQAYISQLLTFDSVVAALNDLESGVLTLTDTATITVKCTGQGTSDNDIIQKGMIVENF